MQDAVRSWIFHAIIILPMEASNGLMRPTICVSLLRFQNIGDEEESGDVVAYLFLPSVSYFVTCDENRMPATLNTLNCLGTKPM